jgi:YaiO family outer membrane protein
VGKSGGRPSAVRGVGPMWLVLALSATGVAAQERLPVDIEAGASREVLSGDHEAWEEYWIRAVLRPAPGTHAYGGVRHTRRFGEEDQQFEAGVGLPLAERWSMSLDGTWSPTQRIVPIWGLSGMVTHRLSPRWSVSGGGGRAVWETTAVNHQQVGVNHHIGAFSAGYSLRLHQVESGGSGARHGLAGSWRYDGRGSHLTLGLGIGQDAAVVGPGDVRSINERSAYVSGTHWLDDRTGISFIFGVHRQGDFFTRSRSSVGIQRRL